MFEIIKNSENKYKNLNNGVWVTSESNKFIDIYSPLDQRLVGSVPAMTSAEVDKTIASAKEAQKNGNIYL